MSSSGTPALMIPRPLSPTQITDRCFSDIDAMPLARAKRRGSAGPMLSSSDQDGTSIMPFPGLQHVAITVSDLQRSTEWYSRLFDGEPVLDEDEEGGRFHHTVFALENGMLFGLHTHMGNESKDRANEHRTGLDHVGFGVSSRADLEQWCDRLDSLGIAHGGIKTAHYGSGVSFRDPDDIALEFFCSPGT